MSNNTVHGPFPGLPLQLWPEALEGFDPFHRELLLEGWAAKRELAALKRLLRERRGLATWNPNAQVKQEREGAFDGWPGLGSAQGSADGRRD